MNLVLKISLIIAIIICIIAGLKIVLHCLHKRFDMEWEKMSQDERWKLQNEARKKNIL